MQSLRFWRSAKDNFANRGVRGDRQITIKIASTKSMHGRLRLYSYSFDPSSL